MYPDLFTSNAAGHVLSTWSESAGSWQPWFWVSGGVPIGRLNCDRLKCRLQRQVSGVDVGMDLKPAGSGALVGILLVRARLREAKRAAERGR